MSITYKKSTWKNLHLHSVNRYKPIHNRDNFIYATNKENAQYLLHSIRYAHKISTIATKGMRAHFSHVQIKNQRARNFHYAKPWHLTCSIIRESAINGHTLLCSNAAIPEHFSDNLTVVFFLVSIKSLCTFICRGRPKHTKQPSATTVAPPLGHEVVDTATTTNRMHVSDKTIRFSP